MICCSQLQNGLTMSRPRKSYSGKFLSANNSSVPCSCSNTCTSSTRDENELREESEALCWRTRIYPPRKAKVLLLFVLTLSNVLMDDAGLPDKASTTRFAFGWVGSSLWYCQIAGENLRVLICLPAFGKLHKKVLQMPSVGLGYQMLN
nr:uncharacterized protein LOC125421111 isoform X1 [Ziziphus jujuba var. spinosa]